MAARPLHKDASTYPPPGVGPELPHGQLRDDERKERAVARLLQDEVLSDTFGQHREYEVRTTITTRGSWQYRCDVLCHGEPIWRAFRPIVVEHMPDVNPPHLQPGVIRAMPLNFARQAVETHFMRCAVLEEYLRMAVIYAAPPPSGRRYRLWILLSGVALLLAYGLWAHTPWIPRAQRPGRAVATHQAGTYPTVDQRSGELHQSLLLPPANGPTSREIIDEPEGAPPVTQPAGGASDVRLPDPVVLENPPEGGHPTSRVPTPQRPSEATASDVQVGDLLRLTGWIHRISRAADGAYDMQLSTNHQAGVPGLMAVVPSPDQASGSEAMRAQLQTVRAFITKRLLRGQEPSPRGSVMRHPVFVQLTGHLSYPGELLGTSSPSKGRRDSTPGWEVRPVLGIGFVAAPAPSERPRSK